MTGTARVERTPTQNDLDIASLVHRALAAVRGAGRFGDRKVFVSPLWAMVSRLDAKTGEGLTDGCTIEHFKSWLLRGRHLTRDGSDNGASLVVLARADLVAAMDHTVVAASEIVADGAVFHFVLDPAIAMDVYAPRRPVSSTEPGHAGGGNQTGFTGLGAVPGTNLSSGGLRLCRNRLHVAPIGHR